MRGLLPVVDADPSVSPGHLPHCPIAKARQGRELNNSFLNIFKISPLISPLWFCGFVAKVCILNIQATKTLKHEIVFCWRQPFHYFDIMRFLISIIVYSIICVLGAKIFEKTKRPLISAGEQESEATEGA